MRPSPLASPTCGTTERWSGRLGRLPDRVVQRPVRRSLQYGLVEVGQGQDPAYAVLVNSFADTVSAKFPMYVVRALGGVLYLSGAIIMAWNLWMTAYGRAPSQSPLPTPAE